MKFEDEDLIGNDDPTQPLDDRTSDAGDSEQDSPPEEPAARAAYYETKYKAEADARLELQRDNRRLEGTVEEKEFKATSWFNRAKELEAQVQARANGTGSQESAPAEETEDFDLAELATADDGGKRLKDYIGREATKIAARIAREQIEGTLSEVSQQYRVTNQFKDLGDPESEFAKAVYAEKEALKQDPLYKGTPDAGLTEAAALRVENRLIRSGKRTAVAEDAREDARDVRIRRSSQPTSMGKPNGSKAGKVEVDPRLANRAAARGLDAKEIADAYDPKSIVGWQPGQ